MNAVFGVWQSSFQTNNGISACDGPNTNLVPHIATDGHPNLLKAAVTNIKAVNWTHIATEYTGETATHNILYRLAVADDLGLENDGSYHHFRASQPDTISERAGNNYGGIVSDYIWRAGNGAEYDQVASVTNVANLMGYNVANVSVMFHGLHTLCRITIAIFIVFMWDIVLIEPLCSGWRLTALRHPALSLHQLFW